MTNPPDKPDVSSTKPKFEAFHKIIERDRPRLGTLSPLSQPIEQGSSRTKTVMFVIPRKPRSATEPLPEK